MTMRRTNYAIYEPITPIQIRPDHTVRITGLDLKITTEEAERICRVVMAHVVDADSQPHSD